MSRKLVYEISRDETSQYHFYVFSRANFSEFQRISRYNIIHSGKYGLNIYLPLFLIEQYTCMYLRINRSNGKKRSLSVLTLKRRLFMRGYYNNFEAVTRGYLAKRYIFKTKSSEN